MDQRTKEREVVRRLGDSVHASAEQASALYEHDRPYRREDLHQLLDTKCLKSAQIIAELFFRAAQLRDEQYLRVLLDALLDAWEARHKRLIFNRYAAQLKAIGLGISADEFSRRQQRMNEIMDFLAMEILCIAFERVMSREGGADFGGGATAVYLVNMVPELRAQCPIEEDLCDVDYEEGNDQERQQ